MSNPDQGVPEEFEFPEQNNEPWDLEERRAGAKHAAALKGKAAEGGVRFEAYLPPGLAVWLLGLVESGTFKNPSEAVFVMLGEQKDSADYPDLRADLLRRTVEAAEADPSPRVSADEFCAELRAKLAQPIPAAAVWNPPQAASDSG